MRSLLLRFRTRFLLCLALGALLAAPGCDEPEGDDDDSAADEGEEVELTSAPVRVARAERGSISEAIESSSVVTAERAIELLTETNGRVSSLSAEEGDRVSAGQTLARIDNPSASAEARRAREALRRAEEDADSLQQLFSRGFLSRADYDTAVARLDDARAVADQAAEGARKLALTAPFDGTISARTLRLGAVVTMGQPAFSLVDLSDLRVELRLPERELGRLAVGQPVEVLSEFQGDRVVRGRLERIAPVVDPQTGTVKVVVALEAEQNVLKPGMFVNVRVVVETREDAVLVDKRAISYSQGQPQLWVVRDGKAQLLSPTLGFSDRDRVQVMDGLEVGEEVVVLGHTGLSEDAPVEVVNPLTETASAAGDEGGDEAEGDSETENGDSDAEAQ